MLAAALANYRRRRREAYLQKRQDVRDPVLFYLDLEHKQQVEEEDALAGAAKIFTADQIREAYSKLLEVVKETDKALGAQMEKDLTDGHYSKLALLERLANYMFATRKLHRSKFPYLAFSTTTEAMFGYLLLT